MKVVCVSNGRIQLRGLNLLTIGKVYDVEIEYVGLSKVYDLTVENGYSIYCSIDDFITVEEWRDKQLKDLGI